MRGSFRNFPALRLAALIGLAGFSLAGCDKTPPEEQKEAAPAPVAEAKHEGVATLGKLPHFSLINQTGKTVSSRDLLGRVWVANFIFTRCKDSCPLQTAKLSELQKALKESTTLQYVRFVSISVDPEFDTPKVLTGFIKDHHVDGKNWTFLTGARDDIRKLAKDGFKLPVSDDAGNQNMPILHGSQFVLVDGTGLIRGYYDGVKEDGMADLKRDLASVAAEFLPIPPPVLNPPWVASRMQAQLKSAKGFRVFHDFKFANMVDDSGITFRNKIVDDAAREYKAVHYDHGNGVAVADVDGDGRYDIYFTTQVGTNELWRNLGSGKFENITKAAGLEMDDRIGVTASFADIDNDGDPDLYVTNVRAGNVLYENDGAGKFRNITDQAGVGYKAHSSGAVFFDFDKDGLLDLFLTNIGVYTTDEVATVTEYTDRGQADTKSKYYVGFEDAFAGHLKPERTEHSILYKNMGGNRFADVSTKMNLVHTSWSGDATALDANEDGWPDLYVLSMQGHDEYYENVQGKSFVKKSREVFPKTSWGAMGVKVFDFNNDGHMDIFVTDMHSDMSEVIGPDKEKLKSHMTFPESFLRSGGASLYGNTFFRNDGGGKYSEVSDAIGAETYWPWGVEVGDLNADGYDDAFLPAGMNYPFRYAVNSVLLNDRGKKFLDSEYVLGVEPRLHGETGRPTFELQCSSKDAGHKICKDLKGRKVIWGAVGSRSSAIFDLDDDGDLDIVTNESNAEPMVLISNLSTKHKNLNFIKIKLIGSQSNKDGLGAKVKVFSGRQTYTKVNDGKSGYLSQSSYPLYFGLGDGRKVDKIEVSWPAGTTQVLAGPISSGSTLKITEKQ